MTRQRLGVLARARRAFGRPGGDRFDLVYLLVVFAVTRVAILAICHAGAAYRSTPAWEEVDGIGFPNGPPPPALIAPLARWDTTFYVSIARGGYPPDRDGPIFHAAFFPLYPLAIRAVTPLVGDTFVAALLISNACALGAALALRRVALAVANRRGARTAALLFLVSPGAHFLSFPYSEGLFAFLCASTLLAWSRRQFTLTALVAALATATRSTGLTLTVGLAVAAVRAKSARERWGASGAAAFSLVGIGAYAAFCHQRYGSWTYFSELQSWWGRQPSLLGPLKALAEFKFDADYYLATLAALALLIVGLRRLPVPWSVVSAGLLWLPLSTGTLKSLIRFQGVNLPLFVTAAGLLKRRATAAASLSFVWLLYETFRFGAGYANN